MALQIEVIRPSSRGMEGILEGRIEEFKNSDVTFQYSPVDSATTTSFWPFAGSTLERAEQFQQAYLGPSDAVIAARGGYGASDTLPHINWQIIKEAKEKPFIGFSDISALNSALFAKADKKTIHGPMPATSLWDQESHQDVALLLDFLKGNKNEIKLDLIPFKDCCNLEGWLFGGCLSVLTNLIGTEYFPKSLEGAFLFLEDTGENPFQIMRHWNQWIQSGVLNGVKGLILGSFTNLGDEIFDHDQNIPHGFYERFPLPIWTTELVGHVSPNIPMGVGYDAKLENNQLTWGNFT